jgi:hypothetical protein
MAATGVESRLPSRRSPVREMIVDRFLALIENGVAELTGGILSSKSKHYTGFSPIASVSSLRRLDRSF